jgi:hypothetical protein
MIKILKIPITFQNNLILVKSEDRWPIGMSLKLIPNRPNDLHIWPELDCFENVDWLCENLKIFKIIARLLCYWLIKLSKKFFKCIIKIKKKFYRNLIDCYWEIFTKKFRILQKICNFIFFNFKRRFLNNHWFKFCEIFLFWFCKFIELK